MKYETTQLSQTISVGGCGTVKERSSPILKKVILALLRNRLIGNFGKKQLGR